MNIIKIQIGQLICLMAGSSLVGYQTDWIWGIAVFLISHALSPHGKLQEELYVVSEIDAEKGS